MADEATWGPPFKVNTSEVTFRSGGIDISASLLERERLPVEPPAEGKKPKKVKEGDPEAPPRAWCILVHGLASNRDEFGELPMVLAKQGLGVLALDMPGHGKSGGPRGLYDPLQGVQVVQDAMGFLSGREEQWDLKPQQWGVIGHSTGTLVAMKQGQYLHAGDVVVCLAPMRRFSDEMNPFQRLGYKLLYRMRGGQNGSRGSATIKYPVRYEDIFSDKQAMRSAKKKGFLESRLPIDNYPLLMTIDGEEIARGLTDPTCLFMVADKDGAVSSRSSRLVYEACGSAKTWHVVRGSGHSMLLDGQRDEAIGFVADWIRYRLTDFNEVRPGHTKR